MQDDTFKPPEPPEDDLDFDDLDDIPDAESWDDDLGDDAFEDDGFEDLNDLDDDSSDAPAGPVNASQDKTFLQKYFYFIVGGIVVVFAGLWFLGQGGGSGPSQAPGMDGGFIAESEQQTMEEALGSPVDATNEDNGSSEMAGDESQDDYPPMLTPAESDNQTETDANTDLANNAGDSPLTPLPFSGSDDFDAPSENESEGLFDDSADVRNSAPVSNIEEETLAAPASPASEESIDFSEDNFDLSSASDDASNMPEDIEFDSIEPPAPSPNTDAENNQNAEAASQNSFQTDLQGDIDDLENEKQALLEENEDLATKIDESHAELEQLRKTLKTLQNDVKAAENAAEDARAEAEAAKQAAVSAPKPASAPMPAPQPAPQKVSKPEPKPTPTTRPATKQDWVLRSAQPGSATLSPPGSNDMKTVETGSQVSGLGKITFIGLENGKWIVRGTQGSVSR